MPASSAGRTPPRARSRSRPRAPAAARGSRRRSRGAACSRSAAARRRRTGCRSPAGTRSGPSPRPARRSAGRRSPGTRSPGGRARPRAPATARSSGRRPRSRSPAKPSSTSIAISAATKRASACSSSTSSTRTGLALAELRPEVLRLALAVVRDDGVGRLQDRVRRAVVLLERDRARPAEVALELEDVADVGAAEGVDRLVRVADGADVPVLLRRGAAAAGTARGSCPGTRRRGCSGTPSASARALRGSAPAPDGQHRQVVEVDGVRAEAAAAGRGRRRRRRSGRRTTRRARGTRPGRQLVLRVRDLRVDAARDEALRVALELLEALLDEPHLVGRS